MNILRISASSNLQGSTSRKLGGILIDKLMAANAGANLVHTDLVFENPPHLSPAVLSVWYGNDHNAKELERSNKYISQIDAADLIIIEAPMYNFSIPSVLKAWVDHVIAANRTVIYGESGPVGKYANSDKKVIIITASGGVYEVSPMKEIEHALSYLHVVLGFIGLTKTNVVKANGLGRGEEAINAAVENASLEIDVIIANL